MTKSIFAAGASALALLVAVPAAAQDTAAAAEETPLPTMNFGEWGFDPELLSDTIDPGDDFFA
ncbi:MAG: hypothetical protein DI637_13135, partial [Citromicrobium sp.]